MSQMSILNMFFNFDNSVFGKNKNIAENIIVNKNVKSYIILYRLLFMGVIDIIPFKIHL